MSPCILRGSVFFIKNFFLFLESGGVEMARKRFVTSEISTDRKIAKLAERNPIAAALWPWFITADGKCKYPENEYY